MDCTAPQFSQRHSPYRFTHYSTVTYTARVRVLYCLLYTVTASTRDRGSEDNSHVTPLTAPFVWLYSNLSKKSLAHTHSKQQAPRKKKIDRQHLANAEHASCPAGPPHPSAAKAPRREALHPLGRPLLSHLPPQSACALPYPVSTWLGSDFLDFFSKVALWR